MQYNCQRSYVVMCKLGQVMCEKSVNVALPFKEPFIKFNRICGLTTGVTTFLAVGGKAAVLVRDTGIESMLVSECTNDRGVCV